MIIIYIIISDIWTIRSITVDSDFCGESLWSLRRNIHTWPTLPSHKINKQNFRTCFSRVPSLCCAHFFPTVFPLLCIFSHVHSNNFSNFQEFADICESLYLNYNYHSLYWDNDNYPLTDKLKNCREKVSINPFVYMDTNPSIWDQTDEKSHKGGKFASRHTDH